MTKENKYVCIHEKKLNKHESEITELKVRSDFKEEQIKELNRRMEKMDKKLDKIGDSIEALKLESAKDDFNIDNRVKALESKLETLKWVTGTAVAILSIVISFLALVLSHTV